MIPIQNKETNQYCLEFSEQDIELLCFAVDSFRKLIVKEIEGEENKDSRKTLLELLIRVISFETMIDKQLKEQEEEEKVTDIKGVA